MAAAAGATLFVVRHEIIPETHRNGVEGMALLTLMAGFIFVMVPGETLG